MKKKYLALLIFFIMVFLTSCAGGETKDKSKSPGETGYFVNHVFTGGTLSNGQEIRNIKLSKGMGSEKLIIQFYNYSTSEKDAQKSKGIPKYDLNVNSDKTIGKLTFKNEVSIKSIIPDLSTSKFIDNISFKSTNQGEPSEIIFNFKEYTEYKVEEKQKNGELIIHVRSQK